jgi:ATP-dependent Clp protease ATP-binding subunit ClpA
MGEKVMKLSPSMLLIQRFAIGEMAAANFREIQPEHLLMALLKFAEMPAGAEEGADVNASLIKDIGDDSALLHEALEKCEIDSTHARRNLRREIGKGDTPFKGESAHRSAASRKLFDVAAALATDSGGDMLTPLHLLTAIVQFPTPAIAHVVLGKPSQHAQVEPPAAQPPKAQPNQNPILNKQGKDLVAQAIAGQIRAKPGFEAQCKAVLQVLRQKNRHSVLLIADSNDVAQNVLEAIACALAAKDIPEGLKGRRLVDVAAPKVTSRQGRSKHFRDELASIENLLNEAGRPSQLILVLPALTAESKIVRGEWVSKLKDVVAKYNVQFIWHVSQQMFTDHLCKDSIWKRRTQAIWIEQTNDKTVPREL